MKGRHLATLSVLAALAAGAGLLATGAFSAGAEENFPSKPIELVLSTSPGSGAARYGQMLAKLGEKQLQVPIETVYKPGGSSNEAAVYMASRPADGYTIAMWSMSRAGYMNLPGFSKKPEDFTYLMATEKQVFALAVPADSKFKTVQDLLKFAKENPGELNIGSTRIGSIHHMHVVNFASAAGIKVRYIPYKGTSDALKDLLAGNLTVGLIQPGLIIPQIKAGKVRALLVLNEDRIAGMEDVPVPSEVGLNYELTHQMYGIMALKGIPEDRLDTLTEAFKKVLDEPEYTDYVKKNPQVIPHFISRVELGKLYQRALVDARNFMIENHIPVKNQ